MILRAAEGVAKVEAVLKARISDKYGFE